MKGTGCWKSSSISVSDTSIYFNVRKQSDHRMASQKGLLSEEYAVTFPTEKKLCVTLSTQEQTDLKLALKLQQQELESRSASVSSECSTERED